MEHIFKDGHKITDPWILLDEDAPLPENGSVIITGKRWLNQRDTLLPQLEENSLEGEELGILLEPDDRVEDIAEDISHFSLILLAFPTFTDGRSYSTARILRDQMGFTGEMRATGDILLDQIPFMLRCGIESFVIKDEKTRKALEQGANPEVVLYMQPASLREEKSSGPRCWQRTGHRHTTLQTKGILNQK